MPSLVAKSVLIVLSVALALPAVQASGDATAPTAFEQLAALASSEAVTPQTAASADAQFNGACAGAETPGMQSERTAAADSTFDGPVTVEGNPDGEATGASLSGDQDSGLTADACVYLCIPLMGYKPFVDFECVRELLYNPVCGYTCGDLVMAIKQAVCPSCLETAIEA